MLHAHETGIGLSGDAAGVQASRRAGPLVCSTTSTPKMVVCMLACTVGCDMVRPVV